MQVISIRQNLTARGIACWMDIDGGMNTNIYDSMAEGVQNACCVVCFMAGAYEASENCRLELQFAKQTGVPIVPVLIEASYKATGWLGIVTAGALWVPLFDAATVDAGLDQLVQQIRRTVPADALLGGAGPATAAGDDALFTKADLRDELERLRTDLDTSVQPADQHGACRLPAGVPELPIGMRVSREMEELAATLLSPDPDKARVGFHGMVRSQHHCAATDVATCLAAALG
jgi:hypothetical protein